jgi:hypothetical protein
MQKLNPTTLRYARFASPSTAKIPARSGESHKIVEIWIDGPAADSYMDITIGTVTVARIPIYMNDCLFVAPYSGSRENESVIALIRRLFGDEADLEADQDEDISFSFSGSPSVFHVLYQVGGTGIDKTRLFRSKSETIALFHILTHSATINASKNYSLDNPLVPSGFPDFKDGSTLPSGREFVLKAIAFRSAVNSGTKTTFLHLWDERFEFFDPLSHAGISVAPNENMLALDIKTFDIFQLEDYAVGSGHKLTATFDAVYDGTNSISANTAKLILMGLWRRAG